MSTKISRPVGDPKGFERAWERFEQTPWGMLALFGILLVGIPYALVRGDKS